MYSQGGGYPPDYHGYYYQQQADYGAQQWPQETAWPAAQQQADYGVQQWPQETAWPAAPAPVRPPPVDRRSKYMQAAPLGHYPAPYHDPPAVAPTMPDTTNNDDDDMPFDPSQYPAELVADLLANNSAPVEQPRAAKPLRPAPRPPGPPARPSDETLPPPPTVAAPTPDSAARRASTPIATAPPSASTSRPVSTPPMQHSQSQSTLPMPPPSHQPPSRPVSQSYQQLPSPPTQSFQSPTQSFQSPPSQSSQSPTQSFQSPTQSFQSPTQSFQSPTQSFQPSPSTTQSRSFQQLPAGTAFPSPPMRPQSSSPTLLAGRASVPIPSPPVAAASAPSARTSAPAVHFETTMFGSMTEKTSAGIDKQFTAYSIQITYSDRADASFVLVKRFSQLWALKHRIKYSLNKGWYALLAPFPPKKWFDNDSPTVVAQRCADISTWLNSFNRVPALFKVPFVEEFLRASGVDDTRTTAPLQLAAVQSGTSSPATPSLARQASVMLAAPALDAAAAQPSSDDIAFGRQLERRASGGDSASVVSSSDIHSLMSSTSSSGDSGDGDESPEAAAERKRQRRADKEREKRAKPADRLENTRRAVLKEIVSTEKSYLACLQSVRRDFEQPLRERVAEQSGLLSVIRTGICKASDVDRIFAHVGELVELSEEFLRRAEPLVDDYVAGRSPHCHVGRVFLELAGMFGMYSRYVIAYAEAMDLVATLSKDLLGNASKFAKYLDELKTRSNAQSLESLMITPIQRVPRYVLLLRELIKHTTDERAEELAQLRQARKAMQGIAAQINERKRLEEEYESLVQLDKCFNPPVNVAKRGRILVKHGAMHRMSGRDRWIPCYVHVFSDMMLVSKQHGRTDFEADLIWPFHKIKLIFPTDQERWGLSKEVMVMLPRAFYIRTPFELGVFFAANPLERAEWVATIQEFINIRFTLKPLASA